MSLDVLTPAGQKTVEQELEARAIFENATGMKYAMTNKASDASVDALIMRHGNVMFVAETKCRSMSHDDLVGKFNAEWLVTFDKLQRLAECASLLRVPGIGLLYLTGDRKLLVQRLCDEGGVFLPRIRIERTQTQRTVNGGSVVRANAFVDMTKATIYQ